MTPLNWNGSTRAVRLNSAESPSVFSAAVAGGPVQGGRVVGSSDSKGAFPLDNPKSPQDVPATMYRFLDIDVDKHYRDHAGRPIKTLPFGKPIDELA